MPKKIKINKQLTAGRPKTAVNKSNIPEQVSRSSELPKHILGSHMGLMITGGDETPPTVKGPALSKPAKLPPRPRKAPPA